MVRILNQGCGAMTQSKEHTPYDDVFPVSFWHEELLDRHNDRIATFEKTFDDRERFIEVCNSHERLVRENAKMREALVAALKRFMDFDGCYHGGEKMDAIDFAFNLKNLREQGAEAIAKAEGCLTVVENRNKGKC